MKNLLISTLLLTLSFYSYAQWTQMGADINGEAASDQSGWSVSMNDAGDRMAIGANDNDGNGSDAGHVRVYEWDTTLMAWSQMGLDIDGEAADDESGYSVSMNGKGDRLAIGAPKNDGSAGNSGHVRVYEWNGTVWIQLGADIDGESIADRSGESVSINELGDRVAIGALYNDGNGDDAGHVRIYEWNSPSWVQLGADIDGEASRDYFGTSVSINNSGNRLAIGAGFNDGNGSDAGHVRIYEWDSTAWIQLGGDIDGEMAFDVSGHAVSINKAGDRVAIGAYANDGNGSLAGHIRAYEWDSTSWNQLGSDIDGEAAGDYFGASVSINEVGDRLAIGAALNDGNGTNTGHTQIYEWNKDSTDWVQLGLDIDGEAAGDRSGNSISLNKDGSKLAIGAYWNNGNGVFSGHVRVYEFPPCEMVASIASQTNVSCLGGDNGSITISTTPGRANYNYYWSDSSTALNVSDTFNTISGLVAGQYFVTISDANNCTVIDSVTIIVADTTKPISDTLITSACGAYTWLVNNQLYTNSGFYNDTSLSVLGCDSVYQYLDLSIVTIDTTITQINGLNLLANDSTASYQWLDCNNGNSPIVGDTNRTFTATSNGSYAVALSKNACVDTSACIQVLTVGLKGVSNQESLIKVYPNPNRGSFTISVSPKYLAKTYQIFDVRGSLVKAGQITNQTSTLDLNAFGKGVYYLQISDEGSREKIVVY